VSFQRELRRAAELIAGIVRDERFDVLHTNTLAVWSGGMAARRAGVPHVWHVQEQVERPAFLRRFLQRFVPSHASRVVGVSQAALENILVGPQARAKGQVIYNAVDPTPWQTAPGRERIRGELGCGPEDVLVGMVARVSRLKGADLWAEAGAELLARHPNLHCFIAGGPVPGQTEVLAEVQARAAASAAPERFHVLGLRRDVPDLMAAMDVLVAPSREGEGSSLTIIQGMFAGKPVVATDVGGNRELLRDGETGLLIAKDDVSALSAAVARLAGEAATRRRMGQAGQARAMAHFTVDQQVRQISEVLQAEYEASQRSPR
jgi:glycosyltransferase involved in cell wall biosynthesis